MTVDVRVVVATHDRAGYLPGLLTALAAQTGVAYEVVVVDDGSTDATPEVLPGLASAAGFTALRIPAAGPSAARNRGARGATAPWLAFTDDDCLPEPGWLAGLLASARGAAVVQGRTVPTDDPHGRWDRTIDVRPPGGLYETCNLLVRRDAFEAAGGFPELALLPVAGRGFGEDAVLGARLARTGGSRFAEEAVVRHRWIPGTYADHLRGLVRLVAFPALVRAEPSLRPGLFLSRRTRTTWLAVAGLVVATRRPVAAVAVVPWLRGAWPEVRAGGRRAVPRRLAETATADLVRIGALSVGSVRAGAPLL